VKFAGDRVPHVARSCRAVSDFSPRPQHLESLAADAEFVDEGVQAGVCRFSPGDLAQAADHARGGVVPVGVEPTFGWIEEELSQQVASRCEVW
jgi:hypothetical protein